jgi:hypothetical protein
MAVFKVQGLARFRQEPGHLLIVFDVVFVHDKAKLFEGKL